MPLPAVPNSRVSAAVFEQCDAAVEQLSAAWQLQISRAAEALNAGWQQHVERVVQDRFSELAARVEEELEAELGSRVAAEVEAAWPAVRECVRRAAAEDFGRGVRHLLTCGTKDQWGAALLESIAGFCSCAVLATVQDKSLKFSGGLELPLAEAPGIAAAFDSRDAVIAFRTKGELPPPVAALFEGAASTICALLPVIVRGRAAAVLIAAGDAMDTNGIEAIAALAGIAWERRAPETEVPRKEEEAHLRAQRFARVRAAEILLYKSQAVQDGRAQKKLYSELKEEIDSARAAFEREYLRASDSMPDYLHSELLRTLANEEVSLLGEEYPGPLR